MLETKKFGQKHRRFSVVRDNYIMNSRQKRQYLNDFKKSY